MNAITNSTSTGIFRWQPATWLRVGGADAATFLQGQFTNDLSKGGAVYGLWLNVKGKVLADSFVLRAPTEDAFWIGSYFSPANTSRERLESFIIADDVVVEDRTAEWSGVTLLGDASIAIAKQPPMDGFVFRGRRGVEATEWIFPRSAGGLVEDRVRGMKIHDAEAMERLRIEAGIPSVPRDIGPADLPNEGGLEAEAISYTKGCYLGQEVMARLKSMGQVRRKLVRVRAEKSDVPALPAALFVGAKQVGELRSAIRDGANGFLGLALISLLSLGSERVVALSPGGSPTVSLRDQP